MQPTPKQYEQLIGKYCKKSPLGKDMLWAFLVGGGICTLGQGILAFWQMLGLSEKDAGTAVSITLIALSALLTGLHGYEKLAKHAGAGTLVPITGFSNSVAAPALEFKSEGLVLGTAAKMFTIAGPVLVYGISTSIVYGMVLAIFGGA
ncbi:stage V sporulation protein AC [Butyricicoccus sp.]|uniref:stage V sporulation protein AC n=1 Tax=Butyricicoccus sp. TaxID=2049021 RepID=UPI003D7EC613